MAKAFTLRELEELNPEAFEAFVKILVDECEDSFVRKGKVLKAYVQSLQSYESDPVFVWNGTAWEEAD